MGKCSIVAIDKESYDCLEEVVGREFESRDEAEKFLVSKGWDRVHGISQFCKVVAIRGLMADTVSVKVESIA